MGKVEVISFIFVIALSIPAVAQKEVIPQLFNYDSDNIITEQYGITSHITWKGYDYDNYKSNFATISDCGISRVRFDLNYSTNNWEDESVYYPIWDSVFNEAYIKELLLSPIFSPPREEQYTDEYAHHYKSFIQDCLNRYGSRFHIWEIWNEMEQMFASDGKMPPKEYMLMLKDAYQRVKAYDSFSTVLMGAIGDFKKSYFKDLLVMNANDYCDALSIHYYSNKSVPENILTFFGELKSTLSHFSVEKPIWITETGYCTYNDRTDPDIFYKEVLPKVYKELGISIDKTTLAMLLPPQPSMNLFKQDNLNTFHEFKQCEAISLSDLNKLNIETHPVLMVLYGERFPLSYFEDLRSYIARGGTVVFPEGGAILYYDWDIETGQTKAVGKKYYQQLHIDYLFTWDNEAKLLGIKSKTKSVRTVPRIDVDYEWTDEELAGPKYLTSKNLKEGDQFITLMEATDGNFTGAVAACYKLNSDLKGNIIIQTRTNNSHRISEELQAMRIPRITLLSFAVGVDKVYYYCLKDYNDKSCYGILRKDYTKKPVYQTLKTLTKKCPSGSTRPIVKKKDHQYISSWKTPKGETVFCVWTDVIGYKSKIRIQGKAQFYDAEGNRLSKLNISPSLVYIEGAKSVCFVSE